MAISSTKPITILNAVESVLVAQALQLLGWESYSRANGGSLDYLRPIIAALRKTGQARAMSASGQKVEGSQIEAHDVDEVFVTTAEAAQRTGLSVRGVLRAREAGHLVGRRFGKRSWQISVTSLDAYSEHHKRKGA